MENIYEIPLGLPGALAITPRPRGGDWLDVDIEALSLQNVGVLVSLLEVDEASELALDGEATSCATYGIEFCELPVPDLGIPSDSSEFIRAATNLVEQLRLGKRIAIHCRQSVGRSGLLATAVMVAAAVALDDAIRIVSKARGVPVPETAIQLQWLRQHEAKLLRGGG
jgi:protein-tyrosine phosphatase